MSEYKPIFGISGYPVLNPDKSLPVSMNIPCYNQWTYELLSNTNSTVTHGEGYIQIDVPGVYPYYGTVYAKFHLYATKKNQKIQCQLTDSGHTGSPIYSTIASVTEYITGNGVSLTTHPEDSTSYGELNVPYYRYDIEVFIIFFSDPYQDGEGNTFYRDGWAKLALTLS